MKWANTARANTIRAFGAGHGGVIVVCYISCCLLLSGCTGTNSSNTELSPQAKQFLLSDEPANATGITECRGLLEEKGGSQEVTLVGRIGGLSQPTWEADRAVFMVADLALKKQEDHKEAASQHDADNCPFCRDKKSKELAGLAMIELVDPDGKTPATSAQDLLRLSEGQIIVVRGVAELDKLGTLLVRSDGLFLRPAQE